MNDCRLWMYFSLFQREADIFSHKNNTCITQFWMRTLSLIYFVGLELILFLFLVVEVLQTYFTKISHEILMDIINVYVRWCSNYVHMQNKPAKIETLHRCGLTDQSSSPFHGLPLTLHSFLQKYSNQYLCCLCCHCWWTADHFLGVGGAGNFCISHEFFSLSWISLLVLKCLCLNLYLGKLLS